MPYKVTQYKTKSSPDIPDFDVWLARQDSSILEDFPDAAGLTPIQVIENEVIVISDPVAGFIEARASKSNDGLTSIWETIWESKDAFESQSEKSYGETKIDEAGDNIFIESPANYIRRLYDQTYSFIESQTEEDI